MTTEPPTLDWDRLKAANVPLNAFVDWDETAAGGAGPLANVTVGVKSNIAVAGLPWTAGMELHRHRIADRDAEVVARLRKAGAAIIGTLNMDEAAFGTETDNPWFGTTDNPHRPGRIAGGSSGGSGAAVAAGLCDVALGTDTMGSIRIPAAHCGVYGFRPATASVSRDGLEICGPLSDVIGPMTRSLALLERVARVIGDVGAGAGERPVATLADLGGVTCDPVVLAGYHRAVEILDARGVVTLPHDLGRTLMAGVMHCARPVADALADADPALLSPALLAKISLGPGRSAEEWAEDQRISAETAAAVRAALETFGAILLPTVPNLAYPHRSAPQTQVDFCTLASIADCPAISIPAGFSDDGLPFGVQLVGKPGEESGLFARAAVLDRALAGYRAPACFVSA